MLPFLHEIEEVKDKFTSNTGVRFSPWPIFITGTVFLAIAFLIMSSTVSLALSLALFLAPLWLPILLVGGAMTLNTILKRVEFISSQTYILLEMKLPRNLVKTPLAMETFLSAIHLNPGESNWYVKSKGGVRPWWSLEMASFEGSVHFFIWTRANYRRIIESQMYAQYPGVQIVEAPDYTRLISAKPEEWSVWGCDFKHTKKEDSLPIKTYVEYGLDKVQKEPEQVDPIANLIEFMGSIGKGEYLWLQFVIRVHMGEKYHKKNKDGKPYTWRDEGKEMVEKIRKDTRSPYFDPLTGKEMAGFPNPTKGESEKMAAIERNISKLGFDVGIRCVYVAKPANFTPIIITHMIGLFKPFSTEGWNGINSSAWMKRFDDYPWELNAAKIKEHYGQKLVEAFRRRQFFHDPFSHGISKDDIMVMSTEELATVYHIPSGGVQTPGLERISSATGEAPGNLPV